MVSVKIVDEPTNYGDAHAAKRCDVFLVLSAHLVPYQSQGNSRTLKARIAPANFSGPLQLRRLVGRCFTSTINSYKYEFCPFDNVTQHEDTFRWNAYSGILGVWQEWRIENNTFVSMIMREGDMCGPHHRSAEVRLVCGNESAITNVSEPRTCEYVVEFSTPLACSDSLLVYPTLSPELKDEWDTLEGLLLQNYVTGQGYRKRLHEIFVKAGFALSRKQTESSREQQSTTDERPKADSETLTSLADCQTEYRKLQEKVRRLEAVLELHGINVTVNGTTANDND